MFHEGKITESPYTDLLYHHTGMFISIPNFKKGFYNPPVLVSFPFIPSLKVVMLSDQVVNFI